MTRDGRALAGAVACWLAVVGAAQAAWPDQPLRIVVPFAAGGTTDVIARLLAEKLAPRLGQPVVIENVGGAGGNNGAALVAKSPPNGTTILMATPGPAVMNQFMYPRMPFDTATAFVPIVYAASVPSVLAVGPKVEAKSMAALVTLMKARPDGFNFGSAGNGSTGHLGGALFTSVVGVKAQHVPYRGSAPMLQDLIAGNIQFTIDTVTGVMSLIRSGTLNALAVTTKSRSPELPDVPTATEAGFPDVEMASWVALIGPAGMPREAVERINAEVNATLKEPELQARIAALGARPEGGSPEDLAAFLARETERWKRVVEIAGIRIE
jgi:tripartite-type tricarboxylate transporter receptor subunit TctC